MYLFASVGARCRAPSRFQLAARTAPACSLHGAKPRRATPVFLDNSATCNGLASSSTKLPAPPNARREPAVAPHVPKLPATENCVSSRDRVTCRLRRQRRHAEPHAEALAPDHGAHESTRRSRRPARRVRPTRATICGPGSRRDRTSARALRCGRCRRCRGALFDRAADPRTQTRPSINRRGTPIRLRQRPGREAPSSLPDCRFVSPRVTIAGSTSKGSAA